MNLSSLFQELSFGELSNTSIGNDGSGGIATSNQPKIVLYANDALIKLYSRFILKEREVLIEMNEWTTNYHLLPRFAIQYVPEAEDDSDNEPIRYILDLPLEPFTDEVIRVLEVHDSNGHKMALNDANMPGSLFTPQAKVLQVPEPEAEKSLSVVYQAKHKPLDGTLDQDIEVPDVLVEAFRAYIAYKVFSSVNSDKSMSKAQEMLQLYEGLCADVQDKDTVSNSQVASSDKFHERGFV